MATAAYDEIADWYEGQFLAGQTDDPLGVDRGLRELLGPGDEVCLEIGCGTGVHGIHTCCGRSRGCCGPAGVFVHVGVHPCFCGGFADRADPDAVVVRRGYLDRHWTTDSWTDQGIRDKVGAAHWPLAELLNLFVDAGLKLERFTEGGEPTPIMLAVRARL